MLHVAGDFNRRRAGRGPAGSRPSYLRRCREWIPDAPQRLPPGHPGANQVIDVGVEVDRTSSSRESSKRSRRVQAVRNERRRENMCELGGTLPVPERGHRVHAGRPVRRDEPCPQRHCGQGQHRHGCHRGRQAIDFVEQRLRQAADSECRDQPDRTAELTIGTGGAACTSVSSNVRPASSGMPRVRK